METEMSRALSTRPIEATVMPLPTPETTPPVTKMYFVAGISLPPGFQHYYLRLAWQRSLAHVQALLRLDVFLAHLMAELLQRLAGLPVRVGPIHRHHDARFELVDDLGGLSGRDVA